MSEENESQRHTVTIYDSEFDSRGSLEVSQWLFPDATNELKNIEQRDRDD